MKIIVGFTLKSFFGVLKANLKQQYDKPTVFIAPQYPLQPTSMASGLFLNKYYKKLEENPTMESVTKMDYDAIMLNHRNKDKTITCFYCKENHSSDKTTFDHYVPLYLGGSSLFYNLRLSCQSCNLMKGSIHPTEMPVTWKIFEANLYAEEKPKALGILIEAAKKEMSESESKLVAKLTKKEIEWREAYKKELVEKGKLTQEQADTWLHGIKEEKKTAA